MTKTAHGVDPTTRPLTYALAEAGMTYLDFVESHVGVELTPDQQNDLRASQQGVYALTATMLAENEMPHSLFAADQRLLHYVKQRIALLPAEITIEQLTNMEAHGWKLNGQSPDSDHDKILIEKLKALKIVAQRTVDEGHRTLSDLLVKLLPLTTTKETP